MKKLLVVLICLGLLTGCTTVRTINQNMEEDIQAILSRVHVDAQEFINHPERWGKVVDSLCADGMILAKDCVQLKAVIKARDIAVGLREG
jgi:starvation-inducible outer membrane lipoprotein